jgi:hypothetical protein
VVGITDAERESRMPTIINLADERKRRDRLAKAIRKSTTVLDQPDPEAEIRSLIQSYLTNPKNSGRTAAELIDELLTYLRQHYALAPAAVERVIRIAGEFCASEPGSSLYPDTLAQAMAAASSCSLVLSRIARDRARLDRMVKNDADQEEKLAKWLAAHPI